MNEQTKEREIREILEMATHLRKEDLFEVLTFADNLVNKGGAEDGK